MLKPIEPQYEVCFQDDPVVMGPAASHHYRSDPMRLAFTAARYKFVARLLEGKSRVAEIGCADGFFSGIVKPRVETLDLYDFDPAWRPPLVHDIRFGPLPGGALHPYDAVYMLDTIEHIEPQAEPVTLFNICQSLKRDGVFIAGAPTLEFQAHASAFSKQGHVNCKSGADFKRDFEKYFRNVFLFSMNDEQVGTGFAAMACYHFALCAGLK